MDRTVIVNFTDYNCPYCKRLDGELTKLVANYKDVKVINIYVPLKQQVIEGSILTPQHLPLRFGSKRPKSL